MHMAIEDEGALTPLLAERSGRGLFRVARSPVLVVGRTRVVVPVGFVTDGASIPWWARWAIESWGRVAFASILHDFMLERTTIKKWVCDWCFFRMLRACGVGRVKATVMWLAVCTHRRDRSVEKGAAVEIAAR